jgi:hypothetical protein
MEMNQETTGSLKIKARAAYHIALAQAACDEIEAQARGNATQLQRARGVAASVLEMPLPPKMQFERSSDGLGIPCYVFFADGLMLRVRDCDDHVSVRINQQWKSFFNLAGLGRILDENRQ